MGVGIDMKKMEFMMDSYSKTGNESLLESNLTNLDVFFEEKYGLERGACSRTASLARSLAISGK